MKNKKGKDLAKIALAAFMLSAAAPAVGHASADAQSQGTLLARGGCGAASNNQPASGKCGAAQVRRSPATSGCGASSSATDAPATHKCGATGGKNGDAPATHACGASSSADNTPATHACGASPRSNRNSPATHACGASSSSMNNSKPAEGMKPSDRMGYMNDSDASSYQGTTTGPGPNGGYPGAPHGSYNSNR